MSGTQGKVIAITGASSGIGEAAARLLAGRGAKVVLGARGQERLGALVGSIRQAGGEAVSRPTDVSRRGDVEALVQLALSEHGRLDVLIGNAGIMPVSPFDELRVSDWDAMIDTNIKGVLYGIAAALPVFRRQGSGHFIHTASTAAHKTVSPQSVYAATKSAVLAISEGLRQEAGEQLRVSVISPGFVNTDFAQGVTSPDVRATLEAARDRLAMPPEAVARAMAYAIEQPDDIDVGEIIIRPTAQG